MAQRTALRDAEKILAALAAAMGAGCRTCAERLFAMAAAARIAGPELEHAFAEGLRAREAATETMRAKAAALLGHSPGTEVDSGKADPMTELCRLAAAAAANSAPDAKRYADAARAAGATDAAIRMTVGIARSVRSKAQGFSDEEIGVSSGAEIPCPTEAKGESEGCGEASGSPDGSPDGGDAGSCACE